MRCASCRRELSLGGTPPGSFFGVGLVAAAGCGWLALQGWWLWLVPGGAVVLLAVAGTVLNQGDRRSMGPDGRALPGRACSRCGAVTAIRPWSL